MKKHFLKITLIFTIIIFNVLSLKAERKLTLIDTTCCTPDSLKLVSYNYPVFCVSWHVRNDSGCVNPYGFTIQWAKSPGIGPWKEKIVLYTSGTIINFCDSVDSCVRWQWRVRTICTVGSNTTYSDWVYGSRFEMVCNHDFAKPRNNGTNSHFDIIPNPATSQILVLTDDTKDQKSIISITDAKGIIYYRKQGIADEKDKNIPIDISRLKPGLYFVRVENIKGVSVKSFIKK
jgi:hypothetical protein